MADVFSNFKGDPATQQEFFRLLLNLLVDPSLGPLWALTELGYCGTQKSIPSLRRFLDSKEPAWRKKAQWAMDRIQARI